MEVGIDAPMDLSWYDLRCDFIFNFASQLRNLEKFTLVENCCPRGRLYNGPTPVRDPNVSDQWHPLRNRHLDINKLSKLAPRIHTLSISKEIFLDLPVAIRKIVRMLHNDRKIDGAKNNPVLPRVIVNKKQWQELQVYKDIDSIMTTTIDFEDFKFKYFTCYTHKILHK